MWIRKITLGAFVLVGVVAGISDAEAVQRKYAGIYCQAIQGTPTYVRGTIVNNSTFTDLVVSCPIVIEEGEMPGYGSVATVFDRNPMPDRDVKCQMCSETVVGATLERECSGTRTEESSSEAMYLRFADLESGHYYYVECEIPRKQSPFATGSQLAALVIQSGPRVPVEP